MWFMCVLFIDIYLLVPNPTKIHLSHVALELYKPKQMKNSTKNEARGSYLRFILLHTCFQCILLSDAGHSRKVWVISRLLCIFTLIQTSLASILAPKKLKIMFCGIWSIKSCSNWSYCALWVLYSLISIFWYQKYISLMLYWNFTSQNRRKITPKMRRQR